MDDFRKSYWGLPFQYCWRCTYQKCDGKIHGIHNGFRFLDALTKAYPNSNQKAAKHFDAISFAALTVVDAKKLTKRERELQAWLTDRIHEQIPDCDVWFRKHQAYLSEVVSF